MGLVVIDGKLVHTSVFDQSTPKNENNYYETRIGDAIDEPPPVNPIPDRKDELLGDTIDIEEYIAMTDQPVEHEEVEDAVADENRPEEEEGVNHGQDMAGQQDANPSEQDVDEDNADTEATERKHNEMP
jgi:hypothetical protein